MNKTDLRTGMIVTTRNNNKYVVLLDIAHGSVDRESLFVSIESNPRWHKFDDYNDDLTIKRYRCNQYGDSDIVLVEIPEYPLACVGLENWSNENKVIFDRDSDEV